MRHLPSVMLLLPVLNRRKPLLDASELIVTMLRWWWW